MDPGLNLFAGWCGILLGVLFGAGLGLRFHEEHWLGGYASWPRRMLRLAHISFFGLGFLNVAFALTARGLGLQQDLAWPVALLLVGAVTMPPVCCLAAVRPGWRQLFVVPVGSVATGLGVLVWSVWPS
ncbi:MAG TPA: hypothetical protein VFE37_17075 [Chloroflexota bacterium]|nr:hypothetical protein [Chloroflexota bacterium]